MEQPPPQNKFTYSLEQKSFEIISNKNNNFKITISNNIKYITFKAKQKNSIENNKYYSTIDLEEIKKNKYFLFFDNLDEIYEEIINLMNKNKIDLIEEKDKLVLEIIISLSISSIKLQNIIFEIKKEEKSNEEKFNELYSIINNLKSYYDKIIQEQNYKIKNLENIILGTQNNNLKKEIINPKNVNNIFNDSIIINNNNTYILNLMKWISPYNKKFITKLLFRKSINGDSYHEFHRLCDNQGTTLVLIEGKEGFIIGGYTTKDWNTSGDWYNDENSFLFNLTNLTIFPHKNNTDYSIRGSKEFGPWFASIGFRDIGKGNLSQGYFHYQNREDMCFENFNSIIPNNNCERFFDVKEVEIYKIYKN